MASTKHTGTGSNFRRFRINAFALIKMMPCKAAAPVSIMTSAEKDMLC